MDLATLFGERLRENEPMAKHTNFRLGGVAGFYADVRSDKELVQALETAKDAGLPVFVLGGGSNTLFADEGFPGLVLQIAMRKLEIVGTKVVAEAGVLSAGMARATVEAGLEGFEWAISLPGTIGGGVRGNAGCYGGETGDHLVSARVLRDGSIMELSKEQMNFDYRTSILKHDPGVILSATFDFMPGDPLELKTRMASFLEKRKGSQPLYAGSAGCVFKNIELQSDEDVQRVRALGDIDRLSEMIASRKLTAGWLIDHMGLKKLSVGGAEVSKEHGNFIINTGTATARDVYELTQAVKQAVYERTGLRLEEEVQFIGF